MSCYTFPRPTPGVTGPAGPPGPKGDMGAQGIPGSAGSPGAKGDTGSPGAKGDTGLTGPQGDAGAQGLKGDQGIQGVKGDTGNTGAPGTTDYTALSNKPTLGSAAATASTDYATAAHTHNPAVTYQTLATAMASHIAAKVAGTYLLGCGDPAAVAGTGTLYPLMLIPIYAADYPTINSLATKLRIRATVTANAVAPTGNFTVGLYPVTSGAGGTGLKIFTVGTLVTGSAASTVTAPAASSIANVAGSDFALPADGMYVLAMVTTATVATYSLVHIIARLQAHNA